MRWPEIFFKSRKSNSFSDKIASDKAKGPVVSEPEKPVAPSPAQIAADKAAAESLRALKQKDSIRIIPVPSREPLPSPAAVTEKPPGAVPPAAAVLPTEVPATGGPIRRKARLTDFARILLPKEAAAPEPATPVADSAPPGATPAAVVPAAFPVAGTAGNVIETRPETAAETKTAAADLPVKAAPPSPVAPLQPTPDISVTAKETPPAPAPTVNVPMKATTRLLESAAASPKVRPASEALETAGPPVDSREKREFILANGERILGHILSETADTIYLDHHTLGVLTLPRSQIAGKPIEVILINGDRIVGDLIAETAECLYIRHASLGMLTVPHSQRSTRVVEAILKDGDRILGEVLAETDDFTVIRSATLGTVAVQHEQVAMLNRKIEQMQLRSLPAPALEDAKPASS